MAVVVVTVVVAIMSALMVVAAAKKPPTDGGTVVVLGARINGAKPSRMLRDRLDVAAAYLRAVPQANCVVSGGLGEGEEYTEAAVMKQYLVQRGIAPSRITEENRSTDTHENITFSLMRIRQNGWDERLVIATQEFHQYRAAAVSRRLGVAEVSAVSCRSPHHLLPVYWVREWLAIARLWAIGY